MREKCARQVNMVAVKLDNQPLINRDKVRPLPRPNDQTDEVNKLFIVWPFLARFFLLWIIKLALALVLFVTHTKKVSVC